MPVVINFKSHNVILPDIASRLHPDIELARVTEAVGFVDRGAGGLVLGERVGAVAVGDLGDAFDDDPLLDLVVALLQAETGAGQDGDALDLETVAFVDAVIASQGPRDLAVHDGMSAAVVLQADDDTLERPAVVAVGNEQGVEGVDDKEVLGTERDDRAVRGMDGGVTCVADDARSADAVVGTVGGSEVGNGVPAADVALLPDEGHYCNLSISTAYGSNIA